MCTTNCPGWGIYNGREIQRCDECRRFDTDEEASEHVAQLAHEGEELRKASRGPITFDELLSTLKEAIKARKAAQKASDARHALPRGSSRARVTTANARHASACERYEHMRESLQKKFVRAQVALEW